MFCTSSNRNNTSSTPARTFHLLFVQINRGLIGWIDQRRVLDLFRLDVVEVIPRLFDQFGLTTGNRAQSSPELLRQRSSLCARWASPSRRRSATHGRAGSGCLQEIANRPSAHSTRCRRHHPSLRLRGSFGGSSGLTFIFIPSTFAPISFCNALANVWSASLHSGMPTASMFFCCVSATTLLK